MDMENLIGETTEYDKKAALEVRKPKSWCKSVSAFANTLGGALIDVYKRQGMHVQFPDLGCAVAQPQSAVQDA